MLIMAMAMPMLLLYAIGALGPFLVEDLDIAPASLGYFTLGSFGIAALLSLKAGYIVNRLGIRYSQCILFLSVAATFCMLAILPGFYSLLAAATLIGFAQALANPVTNLIITRQIAPQQKAFTVGLKQSGVQLAALFAGLLLPVSALQFGWRPTFAAIAPIAVLLALLGWYQNASSPSAPATPQTGAINNRLKLLMAVQCCVGILLSAFITYLPVYAFSLGMQPTQAGMMIAAFGMTGMVSRLILTPLGARLHEEAFLLAGLLCISALSIILIFQAPTYGTLLLWIAVIGMGATAVATNAIAMNMLIRDSGFGHISMTSGIVSAAFFAGFAIGPSSAGELARRSGTLTHSWWVLLGITLLAIILAFCLAWVRHREAVHATA